MQSAWPRTNEVAVLADDEVHIWAVPLDSVDCDVRLPMLSPDERQRAAQFKLEDARRRFVVARFTLRMLLGRYLSVPPSALKFDYDASGKPRLSGENPARLSFNLAHSGELAMMAVATGCEVGVDVEMLRAVGHWREIARRYFHPAEVNDLRTDVPESSPASFLHCWTAKEAIVKALGTGLGHALNSFRVPFDQAGGAWVELPAMSPQPPSRCWLHPLAPESQYVAAVACLDAMRRPRCWTLQI